MSEPSILDPILALPNVVYEDRNGGLHDSKQAEAIARLYPDLKRVVDAAEAEMKRLHKVVTPDCGNPICEALEGLRARVAEVCS